MDSEVPLLAVHILWVIPEVRTEMAKGKWGVVNFCVKQEGTFWFKCFDYS